jgi:Fur family ferric uptake transcriptional regulator
MAGPATRPDWAAHARAVLARSGHHRGAARDALIEALARQDCAVSALELERTMRRRRRSVARASIYRALELLHQLELVSRVELGDGVARYEPADPAGAHHHHLLCERCGALVPFHDAALERSITGLCERLGFDASGHEVTLRGSCAGCRS